MADIKRVIIDAGHGGEEPGAMFNGRREKDDALRLALAIGQILENNGVDVVYTRTTDVFDTPLEKAQIANRSGADYFVSIHRNAMPVPGTGSGATVLVYENAGVPAMLAENIQRNLVQTGFNDLGIQERPGLIVLRRTQMPAVLVEAGFIDNPEDNRFFDENFDAIAQAIADGILETIRQQEEQRPEYYQVQVGAFRTRMPADRLVNELQAKGLPAFVVYDDGLYKVRVGAFLNMDYAVRMERTLRNLGYPTVLVKERAIY
ncbi:N-acetylmuramoyl-L-alanine amidase [Lachnoclostridium pacaense]|uniref:N-acetylmuramoyl-L-alanine amidase n=1 Tax=Enterocloster hominis (ex Hitch et al. 2024) TaxID=1917870 RepID=A0ABV1DBV0_9FIRM|nr:N-acetylmuramoyl-L-alanine amidase [Lachnoclostridium pacaense]MCC2815791.1 N-acetylmuramoyl-L-alanine amidase [Lachnoclostridium pacaense]